MATTDEVEVVVAHSEHMTLRVGDVYLKVDGDAAHADIEAQAMALAPGATPTAPWREVTAVPHRECSSPLSSRA